MKFPTLLKLIMNPIIIKCIGLMRILRIRTGASGYVEGERYTNLNPVRHYIDAINNGKRPVLTSSCPTLNEKMEEEMFLGLRMNQGVNRERFKLKFGQTLDDIFGETIYDLKSKQLLIETDGNISLTERGKVIGNEVFEAFLLN